MNNVYVLNDNPYDFMVIYISTSQVTERECLATKRNISSRYVVECVDMCK
mgnify:CR=1 FL=1